MAVSRGKGEKSQRLFQCRAEDPRRGYGLATRSHEKKGKQLGPCPWGHQSEKKRALLGAAWIYAQLEAIDCVAFPAQLFRITVIGKIHNPKKEETEKKKKTRGQIGGFPETVTK